MSDDNFIALLMLLEKHISFVEKSEYVKKFGACRGYNERY